MQAKTLNKSDKVTRRGVSQGTARLHNKLLLLNLVREHRALSGAEIARYAGLSTQTISVIMRQLETEELILRGEPQRGRIGQPSIPISLNPDGAFFLGARIGRRTAELLLLDMTGNVRFRCETQYNWPQVTAVMQWLHDSIAAARQYLKARATRIEGLGLAMPFRLWEWSEALGAPQAALEDWRKLDLTKALASSIAVVNVLNDATAACAGELAFGKSSASQDVMYFFIGTLIGGGIAQGRRIVAGATGNAGAMGSIIVQDQRGKPVQLLDIASLFQLDEAIATHENKLTRQEANFWTEQMALVQPWLDRAGRAIAQAIVSATAITDSRDVIIDGDFPHHIHDLLLDKIQRYIAQLDTAGIALPQLHQGSLGSSARSLGAAAHVMNDYFAVA